MEDISLLPDNMRGKEEEVRVDKKPAPEAQPGGLKMHIPEAEVDEDIEIIEVDEGDLAAVLSEEPFMTRMTYQLSLGIDKLKNQLFGKKEDAPPPKLPPQFFKPPKTGLVTKKGPGMKPGAPVPAGTGTHKARIVPQGEAPKRVRVIKRVRKPVRVSLISAEELAVYSIDVGRRKWTLFVFTLLFAAIIAGGFFLLRSRIDDSNNYLADVEQQILDVRTAIDERLDTWSAYEDLEIRLSLLDDVLNEHVVISRMFDFLEIHTLPTVSYGSAAWTSDGSLALDVKADSFDTAARQLLVYEESEVVQSVDATSFSSQTGGEGESADVTFQLTLQFDAGSFSGPVLTEVEADGSDGTSGETTDMIP